MTLAIMQPYIFPYFGYFQLVHAVDLFVFYDDVNFIKKGWVNRNRILVQGQEHLFSIPLKSSSQNVLIKDCELSDEHKWREKLIKKIELTYKKAPQFATGFPLVSEIILSEQNTISSLAILAIEKISKYLEIPTKFKQSSESYDNRELKGQMRILDICKKENAAKYINPIGGQEIYSRELFTENQIELFFIRSEAISYKQFENDFVPNLSIIDLLMFNDREFLQNALNRYDLV
jgi:hypothetical protein